MAEARLAQQLGVLRFRALLAGIGDEHLQVDQFRQALTLVVRHHGSTINTFPSGFIAARTLHRICNDFSSFQS
jgi:hypothetical protein